MIVEEWLHRVMIEPATAGPLPVERRRWPHERFAKAIIDTNASSADLAILLRGVLRSESIDRGFAWEVEIPEPFATRIAPSLQSAGLESTSGYLIRAEQWRPKWLAGAGEADVDVCQRPTRRRPIEGCDGDPVLTLLGLSRYTSKAQRDAVRAVFCARGADTLAICLPTGAGKSLCAFLPAMLSLDAETEALGVTVVVVPTVALALDLQQKMQQRVGHPIAYRPENPDEAEAIRHRCAGGVQGPVIVSPEALVGKLLNALREAARQGWLKRFIVDEAHMVLSWGDEFRPAFLRLAAVRRDLVNQSGDFLLSTLLLSATFTDYHLRWLRAMFSDRSNFHIIHAARLRPEPEFWIANASNDHERAQWLEEAIFRLPRPVIVYTTRRDDSQRWYRRFSELGFRRIGIMNGDTSPDVRRRLLEEWNADEIDLVVATSAFGLGVDKPDVRTIVHAQLPESVDRFYQDVGRGGRDGDASLSLLITTPNDWPRVGRIGQPGFISTELGLERWRRMYYTRETVEATPLTILLDLNAARELDMAGDYNRNWNVRTLQLLQRAGALEFVSHHGETFDRVAVRPASVQHLESDFWDNTIQPLRVELSSDYTRARNLLRRVIYPEACLSKVFAEQYASTTFDLSVVRACGGCPVCRARKWGRFSGKILARRVPNTPAPGGKVGAMLEQLLSNRRIAAIVYSTRSDPNELHAYLPQLLWWLAEQGVRNFVVSRVFENALEEIVQLARYLFLFRYDRPPRELDVASDQPTAILLEVPEPPWWLHFYSTMAGRRTATVIVVPDNLRTPDHPARILREVIDAPVLDVQDWANRFVA